MQTQTDRQTGRQTGRQTDRQDEPERVRTVCAATHCANFTTIRCDLLPVLVSATITLDVSAFVYVWGAGVHAQCVGMPNTVHAHHSRPFPECDMALPTQCPNATLVPSPDVTAECNIADPMPECSIDSLSQCIPTCADRHINFLTVILRAQMLHARGSAHAW